MARTPSSKYETWAKALRVSWMGVKAQQIVGGLAAVLGDWTLDWANQANLEHLPEYATAPSVSLIASERQIDAGPSETTSALATRLTYATTQWKLAGTPLGLLLALYYAGFPGAVVVQQNGLGFSLNGTPDLSNPTACLTVTTLGANPTITGSPPWWTIDQNNAFCSRFSVLFPGPLPSLFVTWARATFTGAEDSVVITWNNPWPDTNYKTLVGTPNITDSNGPVSLWALGGSPAIALVDTSARFSGDAVVLSYLAGTNPFGAIRPTDLARMQRVIAKWKPAKATCTGIYVVTQGEAIGWSVQQIRSTGTIGASTVTAYSAT